MLIQIQWRVAARALGNIQKKCYLGTNKCNKSVKMQYIICTYISGLIHKHYSAAVCFIFNFYIVSLKLKITQNYCIDLNNIYEYKGYVFINFFITSICLLLPADHLLTVVVPLVVSSCSNCQSVLIICLL